ncbi:MAG: DUF3445 domain-containing protein [Verrucomicrobiales bacterium]|nr:DUF3445 domain-containing protein [Verrucomicrobiales bacterium]
MTRNPSWTPVPDFPRLFRPDPYRFEFAIRTSAEPWFQLGPGDDPALKERRRLLEVFPSRHAPWLAGADPVLQGLMRWFRDPIPGLAGGEGASMARELGAQWRPDYVLLRKDREGEHRMVGGCVCDPSSWDPAEKLGKSVAEIHSPVPTLNDRLGPRIRTLLERLPAAGLLARENWGLSAVPDRNLHPALQCPRLTADADPDRTWLRVEHQAFRAVPEADGIVFVIWLTVHPLREVLAVPGVAPLLCRALESMPESIAVYKGLAVARTPLLERIRAMVPDSVPDSRTLGSAHAQL